MSDGVYETVPTVPAWSSGSAHHLYSSSKALPVPSKVAIDSYTSTHPPEPRTQRPSLQDDAMVTRPPLPPPRQRSSNSESEISSSPKHSSAMLNRVKSVKGGGVVSDRISPGGAPIRKSPSATSVDTTELSLTAFVDKYSSSFPQRVKVTKGFYGVSDQTAITTGDSYNFHFLKRTTVVVATDPKGSEYSVPLDSSLKVALLYEMTNNLEDAKKGTVFDSCADLLNAKVPPRVVAVSRQFHGGNAESSMEPNEILVFLGATVGGVAASGSKAASRGKRQLKFHSVTHNMPKILPESSSCTFTTSPRVTGASISSIQLQKDWLPIKALVSPKEGDEECEASILVELDNVVLTLTSLREETTIVATGAAGDPSEVLEVIELPKNLDIEVELLPLGTGDMAGLVENTQNRYEAFSPSSVIYYTNKPTPKLYDIQCALYKTMVREEFHSMLVKPSFSGQRRGSMADSTKVQTDVDKLMPPIYSAHPTSSSPHDSYVKREVFSPLRDQRLNSVSAEAPKRPDTLPSSEASGKASEVCVHQVEAYASIYDRRANLTLVDAPKKPEIQPVDAATMHVSDHLQEYVTMTPTSDPGTLEGGAVANLQQRISRLEESRKEYERNIQQQISKISAELATQSGRLATIMDSSQEVKDQCLKLQEDVERMRGAVENPYSVSYHPGPRLNGKVNGHMAYSTSPPTGGDSSFPPDPRADERNKEYLQSMDVDKVLRLLECMSLSQYQEAFQKEQINGETLSDCDETMLQNDLGVVSKLHRMRLLKVITGRHSAKSILDGGDPYAGRFVSRS